VGEWRREETPDSAIEKILDAAEKAFVEHGVSGAGMTEIADAAGCSRGTLYRYFKTRHELHTAYVLRASGLIRVRVAAELEGTPDPARRLTEWILRSVREVRQDPGLAVWFDANSRELTARLSRSREVVESVTEGLVAEFRGEDAGYELGRLRALWLVRVILSLLMNPAETEREERELVETFAVPAMLAHGNERG